MYFHWKLTISIVVLQCNSEVDHGMVRLAQLIMNEMRERKFELIYYLIMLHG